MGQLMAEELTPREVREGLSQAAADLEEARKRRDGLIVVGLGLGMSQTDLAVSARLSQPGVSNLARRMLES